MSSKIYVGKEDERVKCCFNPLRNLASEIDSGLSTLEKNLSDVSNLVPSDEYVQEAAVSMDEALQSLKRIGEKTSDMKLSVNHIAEDLEAAHTEALNAFKLMDEDFVRMEKMLEPFGYKPFSALKKVSINISDSSGSLVETDPSDCNPTLEHSSDSIVETSIENQDPFEEEEASAVGFDGSYTNIGATPVIASKPNKSQLSQQPSLISSDEDSLNCVAAPRAVSNLFSHKPNLSVTTPAHLTGSPHVLPVTEPTKIMTRPKKVIYSKEVYEILGIEPPPEFYAQQCSN